MLTLVIIALCLVVNALFACFEMAFVSASKTELRKAARRGLHTANKILSLRENPERTLSTIQIGITLVGMASAAVGGAGAEESFAPILQRTFKLSEESADAIAIAAVVFPLTILSVVFGELVPKTLALREPVRIASFGARWIQVFETMVSPIVTMLEWLTRIVLSPFPKGRSRVESEFSNAAGGEGTTVEIEHLSKQTKEYVMNLVKIETLRVRDVMVKWADAVAISSDMPLSEVTARTIASGHTRLPVLRDSANGHSTIVGVLHTKEFIAMVAAGDASDWQSLIRPMIRIGEHDFALKALKLMQVGRSHLSVVMSAAEPSMPVGVVTMEDVLEEVVGEIFDEDDDGRVRKLLSGYATRRALLRK